MQIAPIRRQKDEVIDLLQQLDRRAESAAVAGFVAAATAVGAAVVVAAAGIAAAAALSTSLFTVKFSEHQSGGRALDEDDASLRYIVRPIKPNEINERSP